MTSCGRFEIRICERRYQKSTHFLLVVPFREVRFGAPEQAAVGAGAVDVLMEVPAVVATLKVVQAFDEILWKFKN